METNAYTRWYQRDDVLFEIVKQLKGRECSFLNTTSFIRCIKAHAIGYLTSNMQRFNFWDGNYNVYKSVASLQDMPMFTFEPTKRKEQQFFFIDNFTKYYKGYDLVFDFDGHTDFKKAQSEAGELKEMFDKAKLPYSIKMSGSGFHIEIDSGYLNLVEKDPAQKVKVCMFCAHELNDILWFTTLDLGIYDLRRIWKCAWSFDYKTNRIARPLTDEQFKNFSLDLCDPDKISSIRDAGTYVRTWGLSEEQLQQNVKQFFDTYVYGEA
jgi:hypothetical protein